MSGLWSHLGNIPEHIGQIDPRVFVFNRSVSTRLPGESAVLLEEAFKRAATWTTVQPNGNLINWRADSWLEDEEELARSVVAVNRDESAVHLTNVLFY